MKKLVVLFSNLIWNIVRLVFSDSPRIVRIALVLYVIVFNVLLITVAYFLTHQWFNFAGEHYEFNDFYAYSGKLTFILHVFWVYGALTQKIKFD